MDGPRKSPDSAKSCVYISSSPDEVALVEGVQRYVFGCDDSGLGCKGCARLVSGSFQPSCGLSLEESCVGPWPRMLAEGG